MLLATGLVVSQQTLHAAVWIRGVSRVVGSFPNSVGGVAKLVERLDALCAESGAQGVHLVMEPCNGAELPLLRAVSARDWPLTIPDPACFKRWASELGYTARTGTAGAIPFARYATTHAPPERHDLPPQLASLYERQIGDSPLEQNGELDDLFASQPQMREQARQLQRFPGINDVNALPLLLLLHRWQPAEGSGSLAIPSSAQPSVSLAARMVRWLRSLHPAAYLAIGLILALRLVRLDTLPGDLYGDIAIIITYVRNIFDGDWPTYFDLSAGPLYHYLIAPLLLVTGLTYYGIKIASVLTSLLTLAATYLLARDLIDEEFGLLAFFCTGVLCWFLIFSRLGNSQILVPLLAIGSVALALRGVRRRRASLIVAAALVASGGLYTYPQSFIIPGVTGLVLCWIIWQQRQRPWRDLLVYTGVSVLATIPFVVIIYRDLDQFISGYVGDKLPTNTEWGAVLRENIWNTLLAFHVSGDHTFRSNPSDLPQLDVVSGVLFLIGLVFWFLPTQRRLAPIVLLPALLLQVPSILVRYTIEVPSASRTLGIVPFVGLLVAGGIRLVVDTLRRWPASRHLVMYALAGVLLLLNSYRYFVVYADGLPNHNIAFGREISTFVDTLPPERTVLVIGCCWGEMGQPHPFAIQYDIHVPRDLQMKPVNETTCDDITGLHRPATLVWGLTDGPPAPQLAPCMSGLVPTLHRATSGEPVFFSADLPP